MATEAKTDGLAALLADGWLIAGYSTTILAAGAMTHSILLQHGTNVCSVTIVLRGEKEVGRNLATFSPAPEAKKGWF